MKTSAQVLAELDGLYVHGWRGEVFFADDNFIGNNRLLTEDLLPALVQWRRDRAGSVPEVICASFRYGVT